MLDPKLITCTMHTASQPDTNMVVEEKGRGLFHSSALIRITCTKEKQSGSEGHRGRTGIKTQM